MDMAQAKFKITKNIMNKSRRHQRVPPQCGVSLINLFLLEAVAPSRMSSSRLEASYTETLRRGKVRLFIRSHGPIPAIPVWRSWYVPWTSFTERLGLEVIRFVARLAADTATFPAARGNNELYPFDFGFEAQGDYYAAQATNELRVPGHDSSAVPPEPPLLQIQARLNADGNWYFPNPDQQNRDLLIQGEAFRAGAASRLGVRLPVYTIRNSAAQASPREQGSQIPTPTASGGIQDSMPQASLRRQERKMLTPTTERSSRPVRQAAKSGRKKKTSLKTTCICPKRDVPKRPQNAFMVFRTMKNVELQRAVDEHPALRGMDRNGRETSSQASVSTLAARWWSELKATGEAQQYFDLADKMKAAHALAYPGWKYQPSKKYQDKWGDESCTCGAYEQNEAKRRAREGESVHDDDEAYGQEHEEEFVQSYIRSTGQKPSKRAGSRTTLMEPPARRRKASTSGRTAHNSGYAASFDDSPVFPRESHAYGGSMASPTIMTGTQASRNLHPRTSQSRANLDADAMPEVDFEGILDGFETDGVDYRELFSPVIDAPHDRELEDEHLRPRCTSGDSFDSLFGTEDCGPDYDPPPQSRRSSRSWSKQLSPMSRSGGRKRSR